MRVLSARKTKEAAQPASSSPILRARRGVGAGSIVLLLFLAYSYFIPRGAMWNADTRLFLAASIVDHGSLSIDPYAPYTGDIASSGGHYYSDKAPGSSLLAVPVYAFVKVVLYRGQTNYEDLLSTDEQQRTDFLPRYLITLLLVSLPSALLGGLFFKFLVYVGLGPRGRLLLTLGYGLGTIAFAFSTVFFGHQIAALLLFAAFYLLFQVRRGERPAWLVLIAGLLAGYAIITEYPTALIAGCLAFYVFFQPGLQFSQRWRLLAFFVAGMLPSLTIAAVYNTLCFGGPFNQGYANLAGPEIFRVGQSQGVLGITFPHLEALWQTTFGPYRGIFLLSPFLLLAVPGFVVLMRQRPWRSEARLWLGICAVYFLFTISYFAWDGGASLGPRHFVPALPYLVLPIAFLVKERRAIRPLAVALILLSVVLVALSVAVYPLNDPLFDSPLTQRLLPLLLGIQPDPQHLNLSASQLLATFGREAPLFPHALLDNNWGQLFHLPGIWQLLPLVLLQSLILLRFWRSSQ
ncbi:MAG TPA: hypothetical protein VH540_08805 [Ktedonobacterales bacterium]